MGIPFSGGGNLGFVSPLRVDTYGKIKAHLWPWMYVTWIFLFFLGVPGGLSTFDCGREFALGKEKPTTRVLFRTESWLPIWYSNAARDLPFAVYVCIVIGFNARKGYVRRDSISENRDTGRVV